MLPFVLKLQKSSTSPCISSGVEAMRTSSREDSVFWGFSQLSTGLSREGAAMQQWYEVLTQC